MERIENIKNLTPQSVAEILSGLPAAWESFSRVGGLHISESPKLAANKVRDCYKGDLLDVEKDHELFHITITVAN